MTRGDTLCRKGCSGNVIRSITGQKILWRLIKFCLLCFHFSFLRDNTKIFKRITVLLLETLATKDIHRDASGFFTTVVYYVHIKLGIVGNGAGGERFCFPADLGSMSKIQQQSSALLRQMGQLVAGFADSERQRAEKTANKRRCYTSSPESRRRAAKGAGGPRGERSHVFLSRSPESFGRELRCYCAGSTTDEKQQQGIAAGDVQRTGPYGKFVFWREPIRRGLLDRLSRSRNAYRSEDPFGGGESDVSVGFGCTEDHIHPNDDAVGESDFRATKEVK